MKMHLRVGPIQVMTYEERNLIDGREVTDNLLVTLHAAGRELEIKNEQWVEGRQRFTFHVQGQILVMTLNGEQMDSLRGMLNWIRHSNGEREDSGQEHSPPEMSHPTASPSPGKENYHE